MTTERLLLDSILSDWSSKDSMSVYADYLEDCGQTELANHLRNYNVFEIINPSCRDNGSGGDGIGGGDGGDGGDGDYGGYGGDGDDGDYGGYDGDGYGGYGGGDGYDGDGYGGYGGYGDDGGGYEDIIISTLPLLEKTMDDNLYILCVRGTNYPYVIIGEVEIKGIFAVVTGGRIIRRFGKDMALSTLAKDGPHSTTQLLPPSDKEPIPLFNISRPILANRKAWKDYVLVKGE